LVPYRQCYGLPSSWNEGTPSCEGLDGFRMAADHESISTVAHGMRYGEECRDEVYEKF